MAALKTQLNDASVNDFLNTVTDEQQKADSKTILALMQKITGAAPKMWGSSIVGFGSYHYQYKSGREGDWFLTGFSPRKQSMSLYIMNGFDRYDEVLSRLGKYKTGKSCLYIKRLSDVNLQVLEELIEQSVSYLNNK